MGYAVRISQRTRVAYKYYPFAMFYHAVPFTLLPNYGGICFSPRPSISFGPPEITRVQQLFNLSRIPSNLLPSRYHLGAPVPPGGLIFGVTVYRFAGN